MFVAIAMQAAEAADAFARYGPIVTFLGTIAFYALMFQVTRATKQDLKEIKEEFGRALKDSGDRAQNEVLRVHDNFDKEMKAMDNRSALNADQNDRHFAEIRQKMDNMQRELHKLAQEFSEAKTALALMKQRMDFEFGNREPEQRKGA